jgi:hypothetical protein
MLALDWASIAGDDGPPRAALRHAAVEHLATSLPHVSTD